MSSLLQQDQALQADLRFAVCHLSFALPFADAEPKK
jgi:hypothetical protein